MTNEKSCPFFLNGSRMEVCQPYKVTPLSWLGRFELAAQRESTVFNTAHTHRHTRPHTLANSPSAQIIIA